jgi:hypothetical protein
VGFVTVFLLRLETCFRDVFIGSDHYRMFICIEYYSIISCRIVPPYIYIYIYRGRRLTTYQRTSPIAVLLVEIYAARLYGPRSAASCTCLCVGVDTARPVKNVVRPLELDASVQG